MRMLSSVRSFLTPHPDLTGDADDRVKVDMTTREKARGLKIASIIVGSLVAAVLLGLGAVLIVGGIFVPAHYLEPWDENYADQFTDARMKVVAQAELAPSGHNMQPWMVSLDPSNPSVLYLYADNTRLTPVVDPRARQTMVSQGAFLQYLRVSAAHLGYAADVRLFPNGQYAESDLPQSMRTVPVARVTLRTKSASGSADYGSLFLSDTNRSPYASTPLTSSQLNTLTGLAGNSGAAMQIVTTIPDRKALGELAVQGTLIETRYAAATRESDDVFHSTEGAKNKARSGFAVEGQGTRGFMKYLMQGLITIFPAINDDAAGAKNAIALTGDGVAHTPAYGLISTTTNTRAEQVQAGMLYAQVSVRARTLGLVTQPLSQVLQEYPTMTLPYRDIHRRFAPSGQTIQMLVRIGTSTTDYPNSMRRDPRTLVRIP